MSSETLKKIVAELDGGLHGAIVQKVYSPAVDQLWLELRQPGRSLLFSVSHLAIAAQRPESPLTASAVQQRLRKLIGGKRLEAIAREGNAIVLDFATARVVVAEKISVLPAVPTAPREPAPAGAEFPLARARPTVDLEDRRVELERHLKKLRRTREKIADEAGRTPLAEQMKRDGELLSRNLHAVGRGSKSVTLTEYTAQGPVERTIALEPKRTPKAHAEWLFHQYKRLLRGVEIARQRLLKIDAEIAAAQLPAAKPARAPAAADAPSLPYREYVTPSGQRIWVGKGSRHNDTLTFKVAQPHHLWLHARGVPGAHVVVPLEKKQVIDQQTLLDAAHLAFHHSDARGERQGEVSYTHVRYLKKAGAPGAVSYTRETTFWLRVEPDRLRRLTAT